MSEEYAFPASWNFDQVAGYLVRRNYTAIEWRLWPRYRILIASGVYKPLPLQPVVFPKKPSNKVANKKAKMWQKIVKSKSHGQYRGLRITPIKHWVNRGRSSN